MHKNDISFKNAVFASFVIALIIVGIHFIFKNAISNPWLVVHPREYKSLTGIITSNFLHFNNAHLFNNILTWLLIAPFAFYLEGKRAYKAMFMAVLITGVAQFFFGQTGGRYVGFSGVVFGMTAVALLGMLRVHRFWLLPFALAAFFPLFGESFMTTLWPSEIAVEKHVSWLGHLGGFMGAMVAITNSRSRALEILFAFEIISQKEFDNLLYRMENGVDISKIDEAGTIADINTTVPTPQEKPEQKIDNIL